MRLTLRTVLAFLDDVLEPGDAREIGQKINQSKEAVALVAQIRESIRRRRIGAPELAGPGSGPDPNIVSEYLENVLLPGQVVELEQLCRRSELHLAEVAACHKILTMVMGQPMVVSDELRERMSALGATREVPAPTLSPRPVPQMTSGMGSPIVEKFGDGLPEYLTKSRGSGRFWTVLAVLLMAGAWVGLIVSDESIWSRGNSEALVKNEKVGNSFQEESPEVAVIAAATPGKTHQAAAGDNPQAPVSPKPVSVNPPPPAENVVVRSEIPEPITSEPLAPAPKLMAAETEDPTLPGQIAKVETPNSSSPLPVDEKSKTGMNTPLLKGTLCTILPPEELNLILKAGAERWLTTRGGSLKSGDEFAVPKPFTGQLTFLDDLTVTLLGDSRIALLPPVEGVDLRFAINRGRVLMTRPPTSIHPRTVEILIGQQTWKIPFTQLGTELAVQVVLPQPEGRLLPGEKEASQGGLAVTNGNLQLHFQDRPSIELDNADGWLEWSETTGIAQVPKVIPAWTRPNETLVTPAKKQMTKAFEREFMEDVLNSIAPVVDDRRAIISEFATETMALTSHYLEIIPALASDHEETRITAIISLRQWIAEDPERAEILRDDMERQLRPELVELVINLLWGYSRKDAQSAETSLALVKLLGNEELSVRELAHFHVARLSSRNYGYHAQAPLAERNAAISRWEEFVTREKSLVQPE